MIKRLQIKTIHGKDTEYRHERAHEYLRNTHCFSVQFHLISVIKDTSDIIKVSKQINNLLNLVDSRDFG